MRSWILIIGSGLHIFYRGNIRSVWEDIVSLPTPAGKNDVTVIDCDDPVVLYGCPMSVNWHLYQIFSFDSEMNNSSF